MFRPVALVLAAALLVPCSGSAEPPRASEAVLAAASHWIEGDWAFEEWIDNPDHGSGLARATLRFRADGTMELAADFVPGDGSVPPDDLAFRMTGTWWVEDASHLDMRVHLEDVLIFEGRAAPRLDDLETNVMNLVIEPDGSLTDIDDGITWSRR